MAITKSELIERVYAGRNQHTGAPVSVASKRLPFFKVGKELRERAQRRGPARGFAALTKLGHDQRV
jgi:hypothetical protein